MLIAVILSVYILAQRGVFTKPERPTIEHSGPGATGQPPAAEISFLLERAGELRLTDDQLARLRRLHGQWETETADQRAALEREQKALERFMKETEESGRRASLAEIQRRAAPVSDLSAQLASARRDYWHRALQVLDPDQRRAAQNALRRELKLPPESTKEKKRA
jgi:hypothetical protein